MLGFFLAAAFMAEPVTFNKHVAPILAEHCAPCHRPGQTAPFSLLTYTDASPRARLIAEVTAKRRMPPWLAEPGPPHFENERRLTPAQITLLRRWAERGAPEGGASAPPPPRQFRDGWQFGEPDLVAEMPAEFQIPPASHDVYRCFVVPLQLDGDRWVRAIEFRPGNRKVVHHALVFADTSRTARQRDADEPGEGYTCFGVPGFLPSASFGGWTPGMIAQPYPDGVAFRLHQRADLVLQIHYHAMGGEDTDRSSVGIYFSDSPPTRKLMDVALGSRRIDIPPGEAAYPVRDHFTLPVDVWAVGIIPHAHYICRRMRGTATLPGGRKINLITINEWDFNWQMHYRYRQPFRLPAGTRLDMEFIYDNSEANPRNPSRPPQRVVWGPGSLDEMAGLHLQVIPVRNEDATELGQALWGKLMRELGGFIPRSP